MTVGAKRIVMKVSAAIILGSAAIQWVVLFGKGFTMGGVFLPALFTALGIFWLFVALRANCCSEDSCKCDNGTADT